MGRIVVLDRNMINMIAAGEVIERPASVVKELMENSIDAGAAKIVVSIEDGGRKLISVTDDGCGMDAEDLTNAFQPHTTSKIKTTRDLQSISTLGFRGEALASIASVAQIKAVSRTKNSTGGNCIEIDCGTKTDTGPCSADYGTTIQARDLFYKLPARRKFLRTTNTEMGHITEYFTRIALANCDLALTLIHNGREIYRLLANEGLSRRIAELFSSDISENLIETESDEKTLHIFALMGKPRVSRTNSKFQYVFLNGRFIRDKFISHAIKEAYRTTLESNRYPVVFLFLKMPCDQYDVNVHPTKIEVRFYNANLVHSQILGCLREKLLATDLHIDAKLPSAKGPAQLEHSRKITDAMAEFFKKHRPIHTQQQQLGFRSTTRQTKIAGTESIPTIVKTAINAIQIHDSFIITQTGDGFIIIDQHALHERIMYEDLSRRIRSGNLEAQRLLIPESFELTEAQAETIKNNTELFEKLGIELIPFGPKAMSVQAFPTLLAKAKPLDFVQDLIDLLTEKGSVLDAERLLDEVLNMAACRAAIKAGQKLSGSEMEKLLTDRESFETSGRCPHGRPTTIKFSLSELEKQFKRT
ncbi:MAG: DNA mismatch repair endonuclease MutL [Planctomycetota bacterium]